MARRGGLLLRFPALDGSAGVKVATERYAADTNPDTMERNVAAQETQDLYRHHVAGRLRGLTSRSLRAEVCLYTVTPDSGFIVDALPAQDRVLVVSACSGHGFKHSAALGEAVAEQLVDGQSRIDLRPFSLARYDAPGSGVGTA